MIASPSRFSARAIADCIARTFETMTPAFLRVGAPSSARAIAFDEAVKFSILEDAADSERKSIDENGAISRPTSASKRATSVEASPAKAATSLGSAIVRLAIRDATAALYGPRLNRCSVRLICVVEGSHGRSS